MAKYKRKQKSEVKMEEIKDEFKIVETKDYNQFEKKINIVEDKAKAAEKEANKAEESITDEKSFRDYAENKFEEVFGDDLDKSQMKDVIDGILKDNKDAVDNGDWGELIGILNKSFGGENE